MYLEHIKVGRISKLRKDKLFYWYYFTECSNKYGIPISDFNAPTNSFKGTKYKTISSYYIEKIKLSEKFMIEFYKHFSGKLKDKFHEVLIEDLKWKINYLI